MHILYLHQYYLTPAEAGAIRSYYISQAMVKAGHQVTVISSHNKPAYEVKNVDGVTVHYLPIGYSNSFGKLKRTMAFLKFMWHSLNLALDLPRRDKEIVFATSTPLTVGFTALALKLIDKIPYVFEVRDLWPEAPIQLGYVRTPVLRFALRQIEKLIYRQAEQVIALSPGMADCVQKSSPASEISVLPNMADCDFYQPVPKPDFFGELQLGGKFVISYAGALGRANKVGFLLHIAEACQKAGLQQVVFLVAGAGAEEELLHSQAKELQLQNLHFLGNLNHFEVRDLLAASDASYISFDTVPVLQTNSPNKFFDSLAAGKVCFVNTRGWLKELVESRRCGFYCNPHDPNSALSAIKLMLTDAPLFDEFKKNARLLAETEFSREKITTGVLRVVERAIKKYNRRK